MQHHLRPTARSTSMVAAALLVVGGLAACADDGPPPPATTVTATDPEPTTADPTATTAPASTEAGAGDPTATTGAPTDSADPNAPVDEPTVEDAEPVVVGLSEADATAAAEAEGWTLRVVRVDGEDRPVTMDLRPNRVNVAVEDGEVTEVLDIG